MAMDDVLEGSFSVRKDDLESFDGVAAELLLSIAYGKADGMESPQCNGLGKPGACKTSDGKLWFPTSKGLVMIDPKTVKRDAVRPAVYIEQVVADKEPGWRCPAALLAASQAVETIRGPTGAGRVEFHYCALCYQQPEKVRFRYNRRGGSGFGLTAGICARRITTMFRRGVIDLTWRHAT